MLTIGAYELGEKVSEVQCQHCGKTHPIEYGKSKILLPSGEWYEPKPSKTIGFYKCCGSVYLASLNGLSVQPALRGDGH